ncbi:MAG TPA: AraC family transcriptional regulator [Pyrinomonadaceae bacterium]|jgi:AraC-type DNA-binding domain-containing proteins|nr:AraC family transcriptional regulator [Pyrinomonadaceae bacterium]
MEPFSQTNSTSPVVFKRKATWDGIRLEHVRLNAGDLPTHCHAEHVVLISLTDGCKGELTTGSGLGIRGIQTRDSICVLPAGLEHKASMEDTSDHLALYVDPKLIDRAALDSRLSGNFQIVERYTRRDPIISNVGMALLAELDSRGLSGRLYAESLANVLAVHLLRYYTTEEVHSPRFQGGLSSVKLRLVNEFIAENYAAEIKLVELAQVAGMSSFHFAREFKRTTGTTPHQYLIKFRIEQAKALLVENQLPLAEVGLRSGFSHQSHFTRLFRKITGTTPHLYRLGLQS